MSDRDKILREIVERVFGADSRDLNHALTVAREAWDAARAAELDESAKALRIYLDDQPGRGPDAEDIIYWLQERAAALRQQQHPKENGGTR